MAAPVERDLGSDLTFAAIGLPLNSKRSESRLIPGFAVLGLGFLLGGLPGRYHLLPTPVTFVLVALFICVLFSGSVFKNERLRQIERFAIIALVACIGILQSALLIRLLNDIVFHTRTVAALPLLATAVAIWVTNVVIFAFLYWEIDRGGPDGRCRGFDGRADVTFPRGEPAENLPEDWQPGFVDYLYLAYNTSTAFTPTDALPLTARMKVMMLAQSAIALVTLVVVAARAISILG